MKEGLFKMAPMSLSVVEFLQQDKRFEEVKTLSESEVVFAENGKGVIYIISTYDNNGPGETYPWVTEDAFNKAAEKHVNPVYVDVIKKLGTFLANNGWSCMSIHQRPDGNAKMEWVYLGQVLTFNIY